MRPVAAVAGCGLLAAVSGKWWYLLTAVLWKAFVPSLRIHSGFHEGGARVHDGPSKSRAELPVSARKSISIVPSQRGGGQGEDRV